MAIKRSDLPATLHDMGAGEIAAAVVKGKVTPLEVIDGALERIAATEDKVHAWSYLDAEGARVQARILSEEAAAGRLRGPLHGVPFGVKDEFHVKGMPTGMRGLEVLPIELEDA